MMELFGYNLDFESVVNMVQKKGYQTIALQLPEGLKHGAMHIVAYLEKTVNAQVIVVADPCFGACDLVSTKLQNLDVDCIVHVGHAPIAGVENFCIPTFFVPASSTLDVEKIVKQAISFLKGKRIGMATTIQHVHMLKKAGDVLKNQGLEPVIGDGDERIAIPGQILGCNFSVGRHIAKQVDSFLFIGSGTFHPLGLLLNVKKPVVAADPYTNTITVQELDELKDIILKQRYGAITAAKTSKIFGILLGVKPGQQRLQLAYSLKQMLDTVQKKSVLLAMEAFSPVFLQGFSFVDCYVSTACPRIAIDDYMQYKKPIITPIELEIALGKRSWGEYEFDQIVS